MHPLIYDVAVSVDGFIAGPDQDISKFAHEGPVVDDYVARLATYAYAIMGRRTYEFGYRFGMSPGQNPYPQMETHIYSTTLNLPDKADISVVGTDAVAHVRDLKARARGAIYLCGGGAFASALLTAGLVDELRLKRAPILLGSGTRIFGDHAAETRLTLREQKAYEGGYVFQRFDVEAA